MSLYVVRYNRLSGVSSLEEITGEDARVVALRRRFELEQGAGPEDEVVVLSADSPEALRHTHGRYFHGVTELARLGMNRIGKSLAV